MNHVLVVDDEAEIRTSLEEILTEEGYGVATAATAAEALVLIQDAPSNRPSKQPSSVHTTSSKSRSHSIAP